MWHNGCKPWLVRDAGIVIQYIHFIGHNTHYIHLAVVTTILLKKKWHKGHRLPWTKCAKRPTVNTVLINVIAASQHCVDIEKLTYCSIYQMNPTTTSSHKVWILPITYLEPWLQQNNYRYNDSTLTYMNIGWSTRSQGQLDKWSNRHIAQVLQRVNLSL